MFNLYPKPNHIFRWFSKDKVFDLGEGGLLEVLEVHISGSHYQQNFSKLTTNFQRCSFIMSEHVTSPVSENFI